jgi:hypothetical protein
MHRNDESAPRLRILVLLAGVRGTCSGLVRAGLGWLIEHLTETR